MTDERHNYQRNEGALPRPEFICRYCGSEIQTSHALFAHHKSCLERQKFYSREIADSPKPIPELKKFRDSR